LQRVVHHPTRRPQRRSDSVRHGAVCFRVGSTGRVRASGRPELHADSSSWRRRRLGEAEPQRQSERRGLRKARRLSERSVRRPGLYDRPGLRPCRPQLHARSRLVLRLRRQGVLVEWLVPGAALLEARRLLSEAANQARRKEQARLSPCAVPCHRAHPRPSQPSPR
jgi:hypothetical protein